MTHPGELRVLIGCTKSHGSKAFPRHHWDRKNLTTAGALRVLVCDRCGVARVIERDFRSLDELALQISPVVHTRSIPVTS